MGVIVEKNCVKAQNGLMYCWDSSDSRCYIIKTAGVCEIPEDVLVQLLNLGHSLERGEGDE